MSHRVKPQLLDLFCGAGGAAMGYHRAGFEVVGVDVNPQPNYPFEFHQMDAIQVLASFSDQGMYWDGYAPDAIHASPPCQPYSSLTNATARATHPDLYAPIREQLVRVGLPYVIENVIGAPYTHGIVLCGRMFGMEIERHRNFETSWLILQPYHSHEGFGRPYTITGAGTKEKPKGGRAYETAHSKKPDVRDFPKYMDMPWANPYEAAQAIPPAYTEWIGRQLMASLKVAA